LKEYSNGIPARRGGGGSLIQSKRNSLGKNNWISMVACKKDSKIKEMFSKKKLQY
jgi:hypothetical protein